MTDQPEVVFECVVSADLFQRAHLGVYTEETRYYLNGVNVSPAPDGGACLTATDGSMMICIHDPDAYVQGDGIVVLDKPMLKALSASGIMLETRLVLVRVFKGGRSKAFVVDQPTGDRADLSYSAHLAARDVFDDPDKRVRAAQFAPATIDRAYPAWRKVVPATLSPDAAIPAFDPIRLAKLAKALTPRGAVPSVSLTATSNTPEISPLMVAATASGGPAGFAILMPLRTHETKKVAVPTWAQPAAAKAAA